MNYELKLRKRDILEEDLLADIIRVAHEINKFNLTCEDYDKNGLYSSTTIRRRFGSWFTAIEKTQLTKSRTPANNSTIDLLNNIQTIWEKLGRQPKYSEMKKPLSKFCASTYEKRFGTWNKALQAFIDSITNSNCNDDKIQSKGENQKNCDVDVINVHKTKRDISDRMRFRILMRDGFTCKSCGRSPIKNNDVELHVDHIIPWSKGGETIDSNLTTKCSKCNLGKGNAFTL